MSCSENKIDVKKRRMYFKFGATVLTIGFLLTIIYRPFIYDNKINDFGFADIIGSLISVVAFCFIMWSMKPYSSKEKNRHILITTFIYSFFWEFLGFINLWGTFDYKDVIAGLVSGFLTFIIEKTFFRGLYSYQNSTSLK